MSKNTERMNALTADWEQKIAECNHLINDGTASEVEAKLSELSNVESEYLKLKEKEVFGSLPTAHDALVMCQFNTIDHKKILTSGTLTGVEKRDKLVYIDLKAYCEYNGTDIDWWYDVQALNKRLTMRAAESIGVSADEMNEIDKSYYMDKLAEEIELGKTPTSNSQCVKHIQNILDAISPDEGTVNNKDLNFIMGGYTKADSKAALKLACSKHKALLTLLTRAFHRIATGASYSIGYKAKKQEETVIVEAAPVAVEPAPETVSVASEPAA